MAGDCDIKGEEVMNDTKFLGPASATLMIVIIIFLWSPGAWAASKYKTLYNFTGGKDGSQPWAGVIFDQAGNLYGTTWHGGNQGIYCLDPSGCGVVFKLAPNSDGSWTESVLYNFCSLTNCSDGSRPFAGLVFDQGGNLYGTTVNGGAYDDGMVFELSPKADGVWTETVLYTFSGSADGAGPVAGLTFDTAGNLYSTTAYGGNLSCDPDYGCGVVFKLMPNQQGSWTESVLYTFRTLTNCSDGEWPHGGLIFDQKGNLYGTTSQGGANVHGVGAFGTLFKLTPSLDGNWAETVLYNFCSLNSCQDGLAPFGGVIFGQGGNLYGTTLDGGNAGCGAGCGVVFKLAPTPKGGWKETVRHYFLDRPGAEPYAGLMLDASGNLFGTTFGDLKATFGSVFEITP